MFQSRGFVWPLLNICWIWCEMLFHNSHGTSDGRNNRLKNIHSNCSTLHSLTTLKSPWNTDRGGRRNIHTVSTCRVHSWTIATEVNLVQSVSIFLRMPSLYIPPSPLWFSLRSYSLISRNICYLPSSCWSYCTRFSTFQSWSTCTAELSKFEIHDSKSPNQII